MKRTLACLAGVLLALGWSTHLPAAPSPGASEAFAAGSRAFESGDCARAFEYFRQARDLQMEGPAVRYNIGVCQYRLGRYADAAATFRAISDRFPAMAPLAAYNAGLALAKQERFEEAREDFRRAADTGDDTVASLAAAMLDRLTPRQADHAAGSSAAGWTVFTDFSAGYDDNVTLLDEALLPAGTSSDSAFARFFGRLGSPSKESGLHAAASAWLIRYPDAGGFDQNVLRLDAAWRRAWRNVRLEAGPYYSRSTLDGDGFEQRFGAALVLTRALGRDTRLTGRLAVEDISDLESRFAFVEGSRQALDIGLTRDLGPGRLRLSYELSLEDRAAASVSPTRHEFRAAYRRWLGELWSFQAAAAFRSSRYDDLALPRDEDLSELSLTVTRDIPGGWQVTGQYRLSENDSNAQGFSYTRNRIAIGVNRAFQ